MHRKLYLIALTLYLLTWVTAAYKPPNFNDMKAGGGPTSPISFPITGNVYQSGYYSVNISVGNPPKYYGLDVDTGSDLTWALCSYDYKGIEVKCGDDACKALGDLGDVNIACKSPNDPCEYMIHYADGYSSTGVLVNDSIHLTLGDGRTKAAPYLIFGCETLGEPKDPIHQNIDGGILGLGKGEPGILHQLSKMGVINRNIVSHCFNGSAGGGYLYFGNLPNFEGASWVQISSDADEHYHLGSADILFDGQITDTRGLGIIFDSGSTYTYLDSEAYGSLLHLVKRNLNGKLSESPSDAFPICWENPWPLDIGHVASYFLPLALNFTNNVQFEMLPESYLINTAQGNVCLGILNGEIRKYECDWRYFYAKQDGDVR